MILNVFWGSRSRWDLLRTHIFPTTRELLNRLIFRKTDFKRLKFAQKQARSQKKFRKNKFFLFLRILPKSVFRKS
ncbi:hypothetical protein LXL04_022911 [Taraxacum kok-saghyz]